ncbi:hypothetical protein EDD72_11158 [Tepidibacillus fermentans]|uniref:Cof subfamily protein (Haloacid dehalogenase superfamily)/HAD superfamily hydrolase (TIGR01484 family) n=1 Tax=Tepidibacillus fermentans TaxID=1281767 RepID=A0A4R3KF65_9BACI|nr:hypothetical protein EDD72_11158 [Tepidibacillus fermentans]
MAYKLLALDIDGTLFSSKKYILPQTKKMIRNVIKDGLLVTLATGRSYSFAKEIAKDLNIKIPIITHDGALIANCLEQPLFISKLPNEIVQKMIEMITDFQLDFELQQDPYSIINVRYPWKNFFNTKSLSALKYKFVEYRSSKFISNQDMLSYIKLNRIEPQKISIVAENEKKIQFIMKELLTKFHDQIRITYSGMGFEILPKDISKAFGLKVLSSELGIDSTEIIAIGDNHNDIEMIEYAGLGVAMDNAPQKVKKLANYVTRSNDENGIAYVIQRFYYSLKH